MTTMDKMANSSAFKAKLSDFKHKDNAIIDISEDKIDLREKASITYNNNDFDYVFNTNDNENIKRLVKL